MKLEVEQRERGHVPVGAFLMLPLFALPLGGWLVGNDKIDLASCAFKSLLGVPCLTCGATRATLRLLQGDVVAAFVFQPLVITIYTTLAVWGLTSLGLFAVDRRARVHLSSGESTAFKIALVALPLANWAYLVLAGI